MWHRYSIAVNQFNFTRRNHWSNSFIVSSISLSRKSLKGTTSSGISYHLRDIYCICRCCWNVAIYKWKVHNGKIEIISFVVKFRSILIQNAFETLSFISHWKFDDTKGVIRSRKSKNYRQGKRTNNDIQNTTQKTKDRATWTHQKRRWTLWQVMNAERTALWLW